MPLYDMVCPKCGEWYEVLIKLSILHKKVKCPECKATLKRLISRPKLIKVN